MLSRKVAVNAGTPFLSLQSIFSHACCEEGNNSFEEEVEEKEATSTTDETVRDY